MGVPKTQANTAIEADRRRPRRVVSMRGYLVRDGGITHVIDVTDLNYGGCGIRVPVALDVGESVKLSVLSRGCISAQVRWYHDGKAGLIFEPIPEEIKQQVERRASRVDVPGEIGLKAMGRSMYRVSIHDLSTHGCKVDLIDRPHVGDTMLVKFEALEVMEADAAWVEGHVAGLKFKNPIHPAVLDLVLRRMGSA